MNKFGLLCLAAATLCLSQSCEDDMSTIGSSLSRGEVSIVVDEVDFAIEASSVYTPGFDSRSTGNLLGHISVPEYGELGCSFVSRLMCAQSLAIPDSITVDRVEGMKMIFSVARGAFTGDSLAPQQVRVYALTKQLPDDISSEFDPSGYYDESSLLGTRNYTLSALCPNDTTFRKASNVNIAVDLGKDMAVKVFEAYRRNPEPFAWPSTFAKYFPGIYVDPGFGRGCVANISAVNTYLYSSHRIMSTVIENDVAVPKEKTVMDSVSVFATAPEVLNSNNIRLDVAQGVRDMADQGRCVLMSPAGYNVRMKFPLRQIIDSYQSGEHNLSVVNNLTLSVPVELVGNDYGIAPAPQLLMVKTSEMEKFFADNKTPDDKTSFWATYSADDECYNFTSMREYVLSFLRSGDEIKDEDVDFTIVPVAIATESVGAGDNSASVVVSCTPYMARPTLCVLDMEKAAITFTFSSQVIK